MLDLIWTLLGPSLAFLITLIKELKYFYEVDFDPKRKDLKMAVATKSDDKAVEAVEITVKDVIVVREGTKIILPEDVSGRLHPLQTYYWLVTGMLADGKKAESEIGAFSLKSP